MKRLVCPYCQGEPEAKAMPKGWAVICQKTYEHTVSVCAETVSEAMALWETAFVKQPKWRFWEKKA